MKPELLLPAPKPVEDIGYPNTNVQVSPQGVKISIVLAPGISLNTDLNEETMNQMVAMWLQTRKAVQQEMALIKDIKQSRND